MHGRLDTLPLIMFDSFDVGIIRNYLLSISTIFSAYMFIFIFSLFLSSTIEKTLNELHADFQVNGFHKQPPLTMNNSATTIFFYYITNIYKKYVQNMNKY